MSSEARRSFKSSIFCADTPVLREWKCCRDADSYDWQIKQMPICWRGWEWLWRMSLCFCSLYLLAYVKAVYFGELLDWQLLSMVGKAAGNSVKPRKHPRSIGLQKKTCKLTIHWCWCMLFKIIANRYICMKKSYCPKPHTVNVSINHWIMVWVSVMLWVVGFIHFSIYYKTRIRSTHTFPSVPSTITLTYNLAWVSHSKPMDLFRSSLVTGLRWGPNWPCITPLQKYWSDGQKQQ